MDKISHNAHCTLWDTHSPMFQKACYKYSYRINTILLFFYHLRWYKLTVKQRSKSNRITNPYPIIWLYCLFYKIGVTILKKWYWHSIQSMDNGRTNPLAHRQWIWIIKWTIINFIKPLHLLWQLSGYPNLFLLYTVFYTVLAVSSCSADRAL
jgi:hypothetical protein